MNFAYGGALVRRLGQGCIFLILAAVVSAPVSRAATVTAVYLPAEVNLSVLFGGGVSAAETFKATESGILGKASALLWSSGDYPMVFSIYATRVGSPTGSALASVTVAPGDIPDRPGLLATADFGAANLPIEAGTTYALGISWTATSSLWPVWEGRTAGAQYADGVYYSRTGSGAWQRSSSGWDLGFRIELRPANVAVVPLPPGVWGGLGLMGLIAGRRMMRRR